MCAFTIGRRFLEFLNNGYFARSFFLFLLLRHLYTCFFCCCLCFFLFQRISSYRTKSRGEGVISQNTQAWHPFILVGAFAGFLHTRGGEEWRRMEDARIAGPAGRLQRERESRGHVVEKSVNLVEVTFVESVLVSTLSFPLWDRGHWFLERIPT